MKMEPISGTKHGIESELHAESPAEKKSRVSVSELPAESPAEKKWMISVNMDDLLCSICRELMCDPRTLRCGHTYCINCIGKLSSPRVCPGCRAPQKESALRNHAFRYIIESAFPVEYERLTQKYMVASWLEYKKEKIPTIKLFYDNIDKGTMIKILRALDDIEFWDRVKICGVYTLFQVEKRFSKTCLFNFLESHKWGTSTVFGKWPRFTVHWESYLLLGINTTNDWFPTVIINSSS